ncbi:MAG TPA: hypothetical protein VD788_04000 [Candidatus Polarisedimenticolaceae bacterium]|nr:hypothetical protein [Candidatus Polarisedimenticolaceae bacterium]
MRKFLKLSRLVPIGMLLLAPAAASAQDEPATAPRVDSTVTSSRERLFLNFSEDAMITDEQWWEGWLQYDDRDEVDRTILFGQAAFQIWVNTEIGVRVGFGRTDNAPPLDEGNGATDLEAWGKYYWNLGNDRTELAAGVILTVPSGDDSVGLGFDAFALKGFGAVRYRLSTVILTGNVGLQLNEDGQTLNSGELQGETAFSVGAGVIAPWSDSFSFVGELTWEQSRFEEIDDGEAQLLGGLNLRLTNRGILRPAVAVGLQDGSPDWQIYLGYAYVF